MSNARTHVLKNTIGGIFAAGYLMRPLGGIIFGHIGDKYGRKKALQLSIGMMAVPTVLVGCLPVHDQIGVWAPLLLILLSPDQQLACPADGQFCCTCTVSYGAGSYFTGSHAHAQNRRRRPAGSRVPGKMTAEIRSVLLPVLSSKSH